MAIPVEGLVRERKAKVLVVVAPPRTLADLRFAFHSDVKKRIFAEIKRDLTNHPVLEIEAPLELMAEAKHSTISAKACWEVPDNSAVRPRQRSADSAAVWYHDARLHDRRARSSKCLCRRA